MDVSDETLMRYADGELGPDEAAEVAAAARSDPALAERLAAHRHLRATIEDAYSEIADEPVPDRLLQLLQPSELATASAQVVDLAAVRARRALPAWAAGASMAACLAAGLFLGGLFFGQAPAPLIGGRGGLTAQGALAQALDGRLASDPKRGPIEVGVSFADRGGRYCRTFAVKHDAGARDLAGLACRDDAGWGVRIAVATTPVADGGYRQAASQTPPAVLDAVDAAIAGEPFDARQEAAARAAGWKKP